TLHGSLPAANAGTPTADAITAIATITESLDKRMIGTSLDLSLCFPAEQLLCRQSHDRSGLERKTLPLSLELCPHNGYAIISVVLLTVDGHLGAGQPVLNCRVAVAADFFLFYVDSRVFHVAIF